MGAFSNLFMGGGEAVVGRKMDIAPLLSEKEKRGVR